MEDNRKFNIEMMRKIGFPDEAVTEFERLENRLLSETIFGEKMQKLTDMLSENPIPEKEMFNGIDALADETGENRLTMSMLLFILGAHPLYERYQKLDIPEWIFYNTMVDLRCKLFECRTMYGIWGNFVRSWHPRFYLPDRFALGRFQYEPEYFGADSYEKNGIVIGRGDPVINMHIPSCGAMTEETRMDSYRKAYDFYKNHFIKKVVPLVCHSWLLYPPQQDFLPESLNILGFMNDFDMIWKEDRDKFDDAWRVFGPAAEKDLSEWPKDTRLRKAYAEHLKKGGVTGIGYGIFLFDGGKILR